MGLEGRRDLTQQESIASREAPFSVPSLRLWTVPRAPKGCGRCFLQPAPQLLDLTGSEEINEP